MNNSAYLCYRERQSYNINMWHWISVSPLYKLYLLKKINIKIASSSINGLFPRFVVNHCYCKRFHEVIRQNIILKLSKKERYWWYGTEFGEDYNIVAYLSVCILRKKLIKNPPIFSTKLLPGMVEINSDSILLEITKFTYPLRCYL